MARKEKRGKKNGTDKESILSSVSEETKNAVLGIGSLVITILMVLAAIGVGGPVGALVFKWLSYLFGVGYYLIP